MQPQPPQICLKYWYCADTYVLCTYFSLKLNIWRRKCFWMCSWICPVYLTTAIKQAFGSFSISQFTGSLSGGYFGGDLFCFNYEVIHLAKSDLWYSFWKHCSQRVAWHPLMHLWNKLRASTDRFVFPLPLGEIFTQCNGANFSSFGYWRLCECGCSAACHSGREVNHWNLDSLIFFSHLKAAKKALSAEIPNDNVIWEMCLRTGELEGENNAACDIAFSFKNIIHMSIKNIHMWQDFFLT